MRHYLVILISVLLTLFCPVMATAEDVLLGTVISADEQSGKLVLRPIGTDVEDIVVIMDKDLQSDHIKPGEIIRIWGSYINSEAKIFRGSKIFSERFSSGDQSDPTGVRSRLRMGADRMNPPPPRVPR
jgi:hypothetical protein